MGRRDDVQVTWDDSWVLTLKPKADAANDALPWRRLLATWPDTWREQWGRRANELEDSGLTWIEAERQAANETRAAKKAAIHQHAESDRVQETKHASRRFDAIAS